MENNGQMSLFEMFGEQEIVETTNTLDVVKADFIEGQKRSWKELFEGFDEMYAITFSSGLRFACDLIDMFGYSEIVFGCEDVVNEGFVTALAVGKALVEHISKDKSVEKLCEKMKEDALKLYVSRDVKSHEKVFCLKSKDGRFRVITGSANMSASAFCGFQRENITYYDGESAFKWYMDRFEAFKTTCADSIDYPTIMATNKDSEYLDDHPEDIPVMKSIETKSVVFVEPTSDEDEEAQIIVADIKGHEDEMKPMLPKLKKDNGRIVLTAKEGSIIKKKSQELRVEKKARESALPKLHIDYDNNTLSFNKKTFNLHPESEKIKSDIHYLTNYLSGLENFFGDTAEAQKDYYSFLNWYFASIFMPYLRYVASKNSYSVITFPVFGIMYGESNGGKSTFISLLSKMMCGAKVYMNPNSDFTATELEKLKRSCEGLPINFDDLDKTQFKTHSNKIIKDDEWGIRDRFINYPAVAITTNMVPSLDQAISKRAIGCRIHVKIDKETGVKNSKQLNESMKQVSNAMYCEYVRRMFPKITEMVEKMKEGSEEYFPDIFEVSSSVLMEIMNDYSEGTVPDYVRILTYSDYFGDKIVGKNAIQKIKAAWENEPQQFTIDKKKNRLIYTYPEGALTHELRYINDELPPQLDSVVNSRSISMKLDEAKKFFGIDFKKRLFRR